MSTTPLPRLPDMPTAATKGDITSATLRPVIVRACVKCGGKRVLDSACAGCGNPAPPVVHDLGIQAAYYSDPLKQFAWSSFGQFLARRRAKQANRTITDG